MHPEIQLTTVLIALGLIAVSLELVRRGKLLEDYSVLWFLLGGLMLTLAWVPSSLELLARITGVVYKPSAIFICALLLCFALLMHFSVVISRLTRQVTRLTQLVALIDVNESEPKGQAQQEKDTV